MLNVFENDVKILLVSHKNDHTHKFKPHLNLNLTILYNKKKMTVNFKQVQPILFYFLFFYYSAILLLLFFFHGYVSA